MVKCVAYAGELYSSAAKKIIERYEGAGELSLTGILADNPEGARGYDAPIVDKSKLDPDSLDAVIILSQDRKREKRMEQSLIDEGIPFERIVPVSVMKAYGFDFALYRKLRLHTPTIFSRNCLAGVIYYYLGLKFASPLIKNGFSDEDYLRFLQDPKRYISAELSFVGYASESLPGVCFPDEIHIRYPVAACEDINIRFAHYSSFEEGEKEWHRRKSRIDWNNIVALGYSDDEDLVRQFVALPYEKKVCFTNVEVDDPCIVKMQGRDITNMRGTLLINTVNTLFSQKDASFNLFRFLTGEGQ